MDPPEHTAPPPDAASSCNPAEQQHVLTEAGVYSASNLGGVLVGSWTNGPTDPSYSHMNLPPVVNPHSPCISPTFERYKGFLTFLSDTGNIVGSLCFSAGSLLGYGGVYGCGPSSCGPQSCRLLQALLAVAACVLFTLAPTATFLLCDAASLKDPGMSVNVSLYILAGLAYLFGAVLFVPAVATRLHLTGDEGSSCYVIGSALFVAAVVYDMVRSHRLKKSSQISFLTFMIESWVSGLYLVGSLLFLAGSVVSYPALYTPHMYGLFLCGSACFIAGSVSGCTAQLWRYARRVARLRRARLQEVASELRAVLKKSPSPKYVKLFSSRHVRKVVCAPMPQSLEEAVSVPPSQPIPQAQPIAARDMGVLLDACELGLVVPTTAATASTTPEDRAMCIAQTTGAEEDALF